MVRAESQLSLSLQVKELNDSPIYHFPNSDSKFSLPSSPGRYKICITIPPMFLYPGAYRLQLTLCETFGLLHKELQLVDNMSLDIRQDFSLCSRPLGRHAGVVYGSSEWKIESLEAE